MAIDKFEKFRLNFSKLSSMTELLKDSKQINKYTKDTIN